MELPRGTVTFLFSDVEGSTQLLERHPTRMGTALARHHEIFEDVVAARDGAIFETVGDAVYAAFGRASDAVAAALDVQVRLAEEDWGEVERIACRISIHTGEVEQRGSHYFGPPLFRCARLQSLGYGEQTLLSAVTARLVSDALPAGASLQDHGWHRLKDLGEPEHVFSLMHPRLRATFPPLKSIDLHPHNLPVQLSSFVGRERELEQLRTQVASHRLVTVTGAGGMGKTRLALQLAAQVLGEDVDASYFVDLAATREGGEMPTAIADALGITVGQGATIEGAVAGVLSARTTLLVLDNTEQIDRPAPVVVDLLARSPDLRIVVTSRGPLRVRGEQQFPLEPLGTDPIPSARADDDRLPPALRLFAERAAEVLPQFAVTAANRATIAAICERLDGLPLAIELAAARVDVFEPDALLTRLERTLAVVAAGPGDAPERHQTLRATVDWSYQLLSASDRAVFRRLAVFEGGWPLEAGEAVADADIEVATRLMSAALIRRDRDRFSMLQTVRDFALEALAEGEERADVSRRHAEWYQTWVSRLVSEEDRRDIREPEHVRALAKERENLNAAISNLLEMGEGEAALQMALGLWHFWLSHGGAKNGEEWMRQALEAAPSHEPSELAWILVVQSELARFQGRAEEIVELKQRAIDMAMAAGESRIAAAAWHDLALIWAELGDLSAAEAAAEEAVRLRREIGMPAGIAHALDALGLVTMQKGGLERAREIYAECVEHAAVINADSNYAFAVGNLADIERRLGDLTTSAKGWVDALTELERWDSSEMDPDAFQGVAELLTDVGEARRAAQLLGAAAAVRRMNGLEAGRAEFEKARVRAAERLAPDEFAEHWALGEAMTRDEALALAAEACTGVAAGARVG